MLSFFNSPFYIGSLRLEHRLIQGPLAGFSCAPFRELFYQFQAPAYCVSEMISAQDILSKHQGNSRYLYRSTQEQRLCYQLSGTDAHIMAQAATHVEKIGADLIDINCGCPKTKIRKKGAGSALLEQPQRLESLIQAVKLAIKIPLTVKIRIQKNQNDVELAKMIAGAGADALIVHGRRWIDDYQQACDFEQIAKIKAALTIPVIANGDISDSVSLDRAYQQSGCDAYMIGRAGTGKPWLYQALLHNQDLNLAREQRINLFINHLQGLAALENEHKAVLQSKSLLRYYFRELRPEQLQALYQLNSLSTLEHSLKQQGYDHRQ